MALLVLPYLIQVLGPERFGMVAFAQGYIQYFMILTDYGFNLSAPREIAIHSEKPAALKKIAAGTVGAKIILFMIAMIIYLLTVYSIDLFYRDMVLYLIMLLALLGNTISPVWFFQGIQQMKYITYANIIARLVSTACIFILVQAPSDYLTAAFLQALAPFTAGIVSLLFLYKRYPMVLALPQRNDVKAAFISGWNVFLSTVAISAYTSSTIFFVGIFTSPTVVGYFAAADKTIKTVIRLMEPVSQAIYPHISILAAESKEKAIEFLRKSLLYLGGFMLAVSLCICIGAEEIAELMFGYAYKGSEKLLRILSFLPFIIAMSNIFGVQTMLTFGLQRIFRRIVLSSAIVNTLLMIPAVYFGGAEGACGAMVLTECFVTIVMWRELAKQEIRFV